MSLAHEDKINKIYSSVSMAAPREAARNPKPLSPVAVLKLKHLDESREMGNHHQREANALDLKHINETHSYRMKSQIRDLPEFLTDRFKKERDELFEMHQRRRSRLRSRHAREIEDALRKHGIAP